MYALDIRSFRQICQGLPLDCLGICSYTEELACIPCRASRRIPQNARSVLAVLFPYYVGDFSYRNLSRYALPDDYHAVAGNLLDEICRRLKEQFSEEVFVPFVDSSPLDEVTIGVRAGLGVRGLNGQLINPRYGSYTFIGEILTTLSAEPCRPTDGGCQKCGRCLRACPTGALGRDFCRERCRSFITQKKRLDSPNAEKEIQLGGMVWGCDICTDICPMNQNAAYSPIPGFYRNIQAVISHNSLNGPIDSRAYAYKGKALLERNLSLIEGSPIF